MVKRSKLIGLFVCMLLLMAACKQNETYYVKHVVFPEGATAEQKIEMASRLVPSPQQLAWQEMELTAFLHFGINTFTDREWGDGNEEPALFNPTGLNAEQWVRTLKEAGFKMALLTAKHHDGFCLWPTSTTMHSVASSPWKGGKGDVVRELRNACDKYGLKFGVYLSPWDRNAECYGDSPRYNEFFIRQLTELLTNYGEIHEVWFDGACGEGPNGKKQEYDWDAIYKTIHTLQPGAVTAIMGDDVRWVGNEKGLGRETEWSATVLTPGGYVRSAKNDTLLGVSATASDLGSRAVLEKATELFWYPSEVDVSIRPGWFYHADQNAQVRSLPNLVDIYFQSVGYNSVLLLNIPPDTRGLIHETDADRLREFAAYLKETFAQNYVDDKQPSWSGKPGESRTYSLLPGACINAVQLQEDIARGQRVEAFRVEAEENGQWKMLTEGTTVGYKRLVRFPEVRTGQLRLTVTGSRGSFHLKDVGAYYARPLNTSEAQIKISDVEGLTVVGGDTQAAKAVDGRKDTYYQTNGMKPLVVDCGKTVDMAGFTYTPVAGEDLSGTIYTYQVYVSADGRQWTKCPVNGEFSNIMHNPVTQSVRWEKKHPARYLKLEPLTEINGKQQLTISEIGILTE